MSSVTVAGFNFGVTPTELDEGVQKPGERFYAAFYVTSDEDIAVDIQTNDGRITDFRRKKGSAVHNFSEQSCEGCVEFLNAGGRVEDREGTLNSGGKSFDRWKPVEFFINVPEDAEPGYHMVSVLPEPRQSGPGGSVGVVSTAPVPVIYRVPGKAVRDGKILGVRTAENHGGQQEIVTTFYNSGTVTVKVNAKITATIDGENMTFNAGQERVAPGESVDFSGYLQTNQADISQNETFTAYASTDYTTGKDMQKSTVTVKEPTVQTMSTGGGNQESTSYLYYALIVAVLSVTSMVTWRVVFRG